MIARVFRMASSAPTPRPKKCCVCFATPVGCLSCGTRQKARRAPAPTLHHGVCRVCASPPMPGTCHSTAVLPVDAFGKRSPLGGEDRRILRVGLLGELLATGHALTPPPTPPRLSAGDVIQKAEYNATMVRSF